jgi:hypothetical protein
MPFGRRVRHGKPFVSQAIITSGPLGDIYGDIQYDIVGHNFSDSYPGAAVLTMTDQPTWNPDTHTAVPQSINSWNNTQINFTGTDIHTFAQEAWLYVLKPDGVSRSDGFRVTIGEI